MKKNYRKKKILRVNPFTPIDSKTLRELSTKSLSLISENNERMNLKQLSRATLSIENTQNLQVISVKKIFTNKIYNFYRKIIRY